MNHSDTQRFATINMLLTKNELLHLYGAFTTYIHVLEKMTTSGEYGDWPKETAKEIKKLKRKFKYDGINQSKDLRH